MPPGNWRWARILKHEEGCYVMSEYPAAESLPVRQRSTVSTDRPARYIKQLGSHMGRKISTEEIPGGLRLIFNRDGIFRGYGDLVADDANHALIMEVRAEDDEKAQNLAGVLERHLVRLVSAKN